MKSSLSNFNLFSGGAKAAEHTACHQAKATINLGILLACPL